ncbi:excisionase family DNA-binding protein [Nibrella viscosa]|uniref:Excisionase family DNA-binding protein n=1 Tax=Nibrella viscosa TaxID=1084524 RepID=A0ABP8K2W2_9BACT
MENVPITHDALPAAVYLLRQEVSELKQLLANTSANPANPDADERPLSVKEAAEFLGIAPQTVYQNIDKIPHRKRFGRLFFFKSELLEYLNAGEGKVA